MAVLLHKNKKFAKKKSRWWFFVAGFFGGCWVCFSVLFFFCLGFFVLVLILITKDEPSLGSKDCQRALDSFAHYQVTDTDIFDRGEKSHVDAYQPWK